MATQKERWAAIVAEMVKQAPESERGSVTRLAERLGVTRGTLSKYRSGELKGERVSIDTVEHFESVLGISQRALVVPQAPPAAHAEVAPMQEVKTVQVYARAGAGPGMAVTEWEPLFSVTAPATYLYRCDFAVMVDGQSMEPTLPNHAVVGAREVQEFKANELYVACIPYEGLVVKRVAVDRESGEFIFKSDNPDKNAYPDFREPIESAEKIIIGRVVWQMKGC